MVDPVSIIVAALAAGVAAGGQDAAKDAVREAYMRLRDLLARLGQESNVDRLEKTPVSEPGDLERSPAAAALSEAMAAEPPAMLEAILPAARELSEAAGTNDVWNVHVEDSSYVQIGHHQNQYFDSREPRR